MHISFHAEKHLPGPLSSRRGASPHLCFSHGIASQEKNSCSQGQGFPPSSLKANPTDSNQVLLSPSFYPGENPRKLQLPPTRPAEVQPPLQAPLQLAPSLNEWQVCHLDLGISREGSVLLFHPQLCTSPPAMGCHSRPCISGCGWLDFFHGSSQPFGAFCCSLFPEQVNFTSSLTPTKVHWKQFPARLC